ncbi:MAG: hypothetical protein ABSE49_22955 [Polyangiaceae bacterium]
MPTKPPKKSPKKAARTDGKPPAKRGQRLGEEQLGRISGGASNDGDHGRPKTKP